MTDLPDGAYEHLITAELARRIEAVSTDLVQRGPLEPVDAHELLARYVAIIVRRALQAVPGDGAKRLAAQVDLVNQLVTDFAARVPGAVTDDDAVADTHDLLWAIASRPPAPRAITFPARPRSGFATGALLANGRNQPRIGHEVQTEMASADAVDLLCAFIKMQGARLIENAVRDLVARGGRMRLITTTYIGATDQRAVDHLAQLGVEVKVSYEARTTRLHAKAWHFHRGSGLSTAYVGSSNLSRSAMVDGLEWNVRVSGVEQPYLVDTIRAMFDQYWEDASFESYDPVRDGDRLRTALARERGVIPGDLPLEITNLDVRPYSYQQEILDELAAVREVHGRWRNLVVMATGTGKTVVAAIDFRQLHAAKMAESLLFVAHQEHILIQSRSVFRHVLRDGSFGELLVGGERPSQWRHVFASVQSLSRFAVDDLDPGRFDMVIVDEFHHAEAPTYARLLKHLRPKVLVGLTATPERADGQDILHWFGGRPSVELRLWEALERQLLAPFQYFGIHDDVDLSTLQWRRGQGYVAAELSTVYTGHDARARLILQAVQDKADIQTMQAIGFCVSIEHAEFMARFFERHGVPARSVTSRDDTASRREAMTRLANGSLRILFTVDLFNEGVDLPRIDTILLLRPTQSATVFLQQLGRGLRLADGKAYLTVLDFIGSQHAEFRFDLRYRALTGTSRRALAREAADDFPTLPPGCHIALDRVSKQLVLDNLKRSLRLRPQDLAAELARLGDVTLEEFLNDTGLELEDIYRSPALKGWSGLRRLARLTDTEGVDRLSRAVGRMLHIDDPFRIAQLKRIAAGERPAEGRIADMLHFDLWGTKVPRAEFATKLAALHANPESCRELGEVAGVLHERIHRVTRPLQSAPAGSLWLHAQYSRDEACAAFGVPDPSVVQSGVRWIEAERADIFFVTLTKTERHYSPTTMYADRAISPDLFQWESQNATRESSTTGQRYINHVALDSTVHLFLRESKERDGALGAPPYLYAGTMRYVSHAGERPMRVVWRLDNPLPADVFHSALVAAG